MSFKNNSMLNYHSKVTSSQEKKLGETIKYVYENSLFWKNIINKTTIDKNNFKLDDLEKLPVINKEVLQKNLKEMICIDKSQAVDYVCTSGTTSFPVHIPLTDSDLERLATNEYQSILHTGATKNDIFQICTTLDKQFMAGMAYFLGLRKLGAGIIRLGIESLEMHWKTILDLKPTYLIAVPSFVVKLISYAKENSINYEDCSIKKIICIGESIRNLDFSLNTIGKKITEQWNVVLFSTYASTEMATAFTECAYGVGGHHNEELLIIELLDQDNKQVNVGEIGELTITTLGVEGLPLLRYKTGDLCVLDHSPCKCGRHTSRISPIIGRTAHRIKYKGTTFYPSSLLDTLNKFESVKDYLVLLEKDKLNQDTLTIFMVADKLLLNKIKNLIKASIRVTPKIEIQDSLKPLRVKYKVDKKRKPTRVIDCRK